MDIGSVAGLGGANKRELSLRELQILDSEYAKRAKGRETMWMLWAFLSFFGAHRFYMSDFGYATAMLITTAVPLCGVVFLWGYYEEPLSSGGRIAMYIFVFWIVASVV